MTARRRRLLIALLAAALSAAPVSAVSAVDDSTPPAGTWTWPTYDRATDELVITSTFSDPESGVVSLTMSCDGAPEVVHSYAATVRVPARDPGAGGCADYGENYLTVSVVNGAGQSTAPRRFLIEMTAQVTFEYPLPARTGQPFTIRPVYSPGYVPPPDAMCRWEFRWGDTPSLRDNAFNETFGFLLFEGTAAEGFCGDWTFTLPWVPVPQFELDFRGPVQTARSGSWPDREVFKAVVVGTDRRIRQSNLPIAQVLPSTYTPIAGRSITYTRYLVGGASTGMATWTASLGTGDDPIVWERRTTSSTFTITPPTTGRLLVQWYKEADGRLLSAGYDPPVRRADTADPNTRAPSVRFAPGGSDASVPVQVSWSGTDSGWGIASYQLQRSVDGGAWRTVGLPSPRTTSITQRLAHGTAYRYRVRAADKAGNTGAWDVESAFRPRRTADTSTTVTYSRGWAIVGDPTAHGALVHETGTAGRAVSLEFRGRAVAWIAERGATFGKARVYVDGKYIKTVDTGLATNLPRRLVFRMAWPTVGTHKIRIVALGTAGRPTISVDGFAILR